MRRARDRTRERAGPRGARGARRGPASRARDRRWRSARNRAGDRASGRVARGRTRDGAGARARKDSMSEKRVTTQEVLDAIARERRRLMESIEALGPVATTVP